MMISFNPEKNVLLKRTRNISFEEILVAISEGFLLDVIEHPNQEKFSGQKIFVVQIEQYVYCVPFIENDTGIFLKTIFPSRKLTKEYQHLFKGVENEKR